MLKIGNSISIKKQKNITAINELISHFKKKLRETEIFNGSSATNSLQNQTMGGFGSNQYGHGNFLGNTNLYSNQSK